MRRRETWWWVEKVVWVFLALTVFVFFTGLARAQVAITTPTGLPTIEVGKQYPVAFRATGGTPPYTWSIDPATIPAGMGLTTDGYMTGSPMSPGDYQLTVTATDAAGLSATMSFRLPAVTNIVTNVMPPLKITEAQKMADGTSVLLRTYEMPGSWGLQVFGDRLAPAVMMAGENGVTTRWFMGFKDKDGNQFTLGPNGEVYRNAVRLYSTSSTGVVQKMSASRIVKFGNDIYALGKSNNIWYQWNGSQTVNKWVTLPVDFDATILN